MMLVWDSNAGGDFQAYGFRVDVARELERRWHEDGLMGGDRSFLSVVQQAELAGWVTWRQFDRSAALEIGIALFEPFRGRGVGTAAQGLLVDYLFANTPVHRLQAGTEVGNIAEERALERAGFKKEGVLRGLHFRAGEWRDSTIYARLRTDG